MKMKIEIEVENPSEIGSILELLSSKGVISQTEKKTEVKKKTEVTSEAKAEAKSEEKAEELKAVTLEDIIQAARAHSAKHSRTDTIKLIQDAYGVKTIQEVPKEKYDELIAKLAE